ncbi:hypothetical protein ATH33_2017 [Thermoactinomyces vulgaris]|jgi:hypothetical protein|nr:hypothetical protein ATH33_2017 [Thermoactinomyces vulgaris]
MIQMKTWNEFFKPYQAITIQGIAKYFNHVIQEQWEVILKEYREEWNRKFYEIGEQVYGLYLGKVLNPVFRELWEAGFVTKPGFILPNSIEHWGPPEERERCMWCVVKDQNGTPLGSLVLRVFHSHVRFNVPHAPDVFSLEETEREAIQNAICNASVRLNQKYRGVWQEQKNDGWEYSVETGLGDYLNAGRGEVEVSYLDHALASWGRNGWELVSVVPHGNRLLAFFKRPVQKQS